MEELWMLKEFLRIRKKRDLLQAQLHDNFEWYVPLLQKCEMCRCNMQHGSATISKFNAPLLFDITVRINKFMNSDMNFLECSNQTNVQSHKSRFVKCQIASTISRWRKTDRAITISIKTNNETRNRGPCVQPRLTEFIGKRQINNATMLGQPSTWLPRSDGRSDNTS